MNNFTFADVPINEVFVTNTGRSMFAKVDDQYNVAYTERSATQLPGGFAIDLAEGIRVWFPAERCVSAPKISDFSELANRYAISVNKRLETIDKIK